jgi:predicted 3-demethylubiquinone-9 3-methyltransferase (glyoxalase superfamily)
MATTSQRISPMLWFDTEAEEAAVFYTSIFKNSSIRSTARYSKEASQAAGRPEGSVMVVNFQLDGQDFTALNGGPIFKFTEAISLVVNCRDQAEVDYYWGKLTAGGDPAAQQCGWLKDKFGVSWQVVPAVLGELMSDPRKGSRAMAALLKMKKLDIAELQRAANG